MFVVLVSDTQCLWQVLSLSKGGKLRGEKLLGGSVVVRNYDTNI